VLLLCEIAAQPFLELNGSDYHADAACKNAGKMATKGVGITQPAGWQDCGEALDHEELKGVVMPKGALANVSPPGAYLQYNEYIVYRPQQIRVRYLLLVDIKG